jgi:RNA polymerase-binding protein DksA
MATTLTSEQQARFARKLLELRDELAQRIARAQATSQAVLDPIEATDDRAERGEISDDALTLGTHYTREQHEVDDALLRIERGEYGVCEVCGKPIELERFEAQPTARLCEEDARREDRRESPSL